MDRKQINSYIGLHTFGRSLVVFAAIMDVNPTNCMASSIADNFTGRQANCCAYSQRGIMAMASLPPTHVVLHPLLRRRPQLKSLLFIVKPLIKSGHFSYCLSTLAARFLKLLEDRNDIPSVEISHRLVRWP